MAAPSIPPRSPMTQQGTATARMVHITDTPHLTPTCPTLCGGEAEFKDCLTVDQYKEFKQQDQLIAEDWCAECSDRVDQGGVFYIAATLPKKK